MKHEEAYESNDEIGNLLNGFIFASDAIIDFFLP